eukprot:TRINITY_DN5988_c0_g4_i1.p1 TRINITY_DN5988_c0_g4~~TRINITY_DN5988_c0_g4_i1.p1  ORF type:complete len:344 (+),score=43.29 TRINITY_DN5988_c0_g4_i1:56-1087(+)
MPDEACDTDDPFEWEVRDTSTTSFSHHAVAGSFAGVAEHVSMFPMDTVKTRMQASDRPIGALEAARAVLHERGAGGLFRGATVIAAGSVPAHIGLFGTYEYAVARLIDQRRSEEHQPLAAAACGASGAVAHDFILTPSDVVKQRLQLGRHNGATDCVMSMLRQEGVLAFWRSLPATLFMNVPFTAILVATNHSLQLLYRSRFQDAEATLASAPGYFVGAGLSGIVAAAATSPLDVVKTWLQTREVHLASATSGAVGVSRVAVPASSGIMWAARDILRCRGVRGFFQGVGPRVCIAAPSAAICWGTYQTVSGVLKTLSLPSRKPVWVGDRFLQETTAVACESRQ